MSIFYANTINELQKIFQKTKTVIFLGITAILSVSSALLVFFIQSKFGIIALSQSNLPVVVLSPFNNILLPLFIFMAGADIFSGEIGDKTLKLVLIRPISRLKIFLSKIAALGVYILVNLFVVFIFSFVSGLIFNLQGSSLTGLLNRLEAYILSIVPAICLATLAALVSQLFKNSNGALTTCIFIYILLRMLPIISSTTSKVLFTSYMDWHTLWLANAVGAGRLINIFIMMLSYCIIFFTSGFYLFDKKSL